MSHHVFERANRPVFRLPARVFLYGLHEGPAPRRDGRSAAAVGLLGPDSFDIAHVYPPGQFALWNTVTRAARGGVRWLLFMNHDGRAATGTIDPEFRFVQAQGYGAGEHRGWATVAVDGQGELLLANPTRGTTSEIGFGQVEPDGAFVVWWSIPSPLPPPERLLGLPTSHAWLTRTAGPPATSTVSLLHRGSVVASRTWQETWTGMAVHGDLLALYRGVIQFPVSGGTQTNPPHYEVCRVGADHSITTLWNYEDFPALIDDARGRDIDTPVASLFYQFSVGSNVAEVRSLTATGFTRTAPLGQLRQLVPDLPDTGLGWSNIAAC